ncbi:MAG: hypothetical protein HYY61_00185 [Deltaproteobacteria bacterium]|nr:hypothetical protein [Deltaproteobacteria bacterium]
MTHDQSAVVREEEKVSEEKLAELWEKALTEMPNVTTEEELQNPQKRDILKKWQERQKQQEVWNKLIEIGSDKVVEKLKSIIFSSASPRTRAMAFRALFKILDEKNDREGLMSLLEQGILDSTLAKSAYGYLGNLYASYESSPSQRDRIETIISGQLWSQTTPDAISFLLSHHSSVTTLNQLRAIPALDNYLATISLRTDQPDLSGINDDVFSYPDNSPDNLMRYLLMGIQKRLRIGGGGYVNSAPKNTNEENEESSQLFSPTSDDLQFVNQALPVIVKHLSWIDSQQALEQLLESPFVVETYKVKIKERIRQLIEIKKTKLNQELDQVNSR